MHAETGPRSQHTAHRGSLRGAALSEEANRADEHNDGYDRGMAKAKEDRRSPHSPTQKLPYPDPREQVYLLEADPNPAQHLGHGYRSGLTEPPALLLLILFVLTLTEWFSLISHLQVFSPASSLEIPVPVPTSRVSFLMISVNQSR